MSSKKIFDAMEAGNWKKVEEIVTAKPSFWSGEEAWGIECMTPLSNLDTIRYLGI
jgi:hypothetical protein